MLEGLYYNIDSFGEEGVKLELKNDASSVLRVVAVSLIVVLEIKLSYSGTPQCGTLLGPRERVS